MNLNVEMWQDFKMSSLFDMKNGFFNNKPEAVYERTETSVPFLGATAENNGITDYCDIESIKTSSRTGENDNTLSGKIFGGNCITITNDGSVCYAYYQKDSFSCSHSMTICRPKFNLNMLRAMFICSIINKERFKWSYGRKLHDINKSKGIIIKLPIQDHPDGSPLIDNTFKYSEDGYVPDWQFMEDYIKSLHYKPLTTKRNSINNVELNVGQWEEFTISALFKLVHGKANDGMLEDGDDCVYLGAKRNDCGFMRKCKYDKNLAHEGNCICFITNGEGSVGYAFYKGLEDRFIATIDLVMGYADFLTPAIGIFIATCLCLERRKYSHGRKWKKTLPSTAIKLPIQRDESGKPVLDNTFKYSDQGYVPDWRFMEDYINSLPYSDRI